MALTCCQPVPWGVAPGRSWTQVSEKGPSGHQPGLCAPLQSSPPQKPREEPGVSLVSGGLWGGGREGSSELVGTAPTLLSPHAGTPPALPELPAGPGRGAQCPARRDACWPREARRRPAPVAAAPCPPPARAWAWWGAGFVATSRSPDLPPPGELGGRRGPRENPPLSLGQEQASPSLSGDAPTLAVLPGGPRTGARVSVEGSRSLAGLGLQDARPQQQAQCLRSPLAPLARPHSCRAPKSLSFPPNVAAPSRLCASTAELQAATRMPPMCPESFRARVNRTPSHGIAPVSPPHPNRESLRVGLVPSISVPQPRVSH